MRVAVTGGAGFLGSHLVEALVERGDEVVVIDNMRRGSPQNIAEQIRPEVDLQVGDIRNKEDAERALADAEIVYHLAAQSNVMGATADTDYSFTSNVGGTLTVLRAAACTGARRVIFASSREVYGEPETLPVAEGSVLNAKNLYGASKVAGEAYCRAWQGVSGLEVSVLRFANVYGPRDRDRVIPLWLERSAAGEDLLLYGGEQMLDFVWVGTAVEALLAAESAPVNGPINVGSGKGTPLRSLAERVLEISGRKSAVQLLPSRDVEVVRFVAAVGKMRDVLGVEPLDDPLVYLPLCRNGGN